MSLFNFNINNAITISNDVNDFDYESALVAKHYNNIPNIYTIDHNLFSDDFWSLLNSQFTIKQENINVKIVMNLDIKLRKQKSYQYFIHIETPDIFISFALNDLSFTNFPLFISWIFPTILFNSSSILENLLSCTSIFKEERIE